MTHSDHGRTFRRFALTPFEGIDARRLRRRPPSVGSLAQLQGKQGGQCVADYPRVCVRMPSQFRTYSYNSSKLRS